MVGLPGGMSKESMDIAAEAMRNEDLEGFMQMWEGAFIQDYEEFKDKTPQEIADLIVNGLEFVWKAYEFAFSFLGVDFSEIPEKIFFDKMMNRLKSGEANPLIEKMMTNLKESYDG